MIAFNPFLTVCWNSNLVVQMLWNLSNDDLVNCCWTVFLVSRQRVLTLPRYISYCKFIYMLALFLLQMSTCVGLVLTANVFTCWSCSYWKCLHVLVLFLLKMSTHVGHVPSANVFTCWSCSYWKCLHMLVPYWKCLYVLVLFFCKDTFTPSAWCSIGWLLDFKNGIF